MRAVDTNVLVRLLVRDDFKQAHAAAAVEMLLDHRTLVIQDSA